MTISQNMKEHVPNKKASDLWAMVPEHNKEIGQRQDFNDYKVIQDKYLRNLGMKDLIHKNYDTCQIKDYRQTKNRKTDKMSKLRKEIEFLERGM